MGSPRAWEDIPTSTGVGKYLGLIVRAGVTPCVQRQVHVCAPVCMCAPVCVHVCVCLHSPPWCPGWLCEQWWRQLFCHQGQHNPIWGPNLP